MSLGGFKFIRNLRLWRNKFWRFEDRFGLVTSGVPLFFMCYFILYVGVVVMDKQAEHRFLRVQSLTNREMTLREEYDQNSKMLAAGNSSDSFENVPVNK